MAPLRPPARGGATADRGHMDLDLDDDQRLFVETTQRFLADTCSPAEVRRLAEETDGFDTGWWRQAATLGWTSLLAPAAFGGGSISGEGVFELTLLAFEMGRHVAPGPFIGTNVVVGALAQSGTADQQRAHLPGLLEGSAIAAWCLGEAGWPFGIPGVQVRDGSPGDSLVLSGRTSPVPYAAVADIFLVTARIGDGVVQLLVPAATPGVTVERLGSIDLVRRFGAVTFDDVEVPASAVVGDGDAAGDVERQTQLVLVLHCAETVGALGQVFDRTLDWSFDRLSFGRPLASYQALKHRLADDKTRLEACKATATAAARSLEDPGGDPVRLTRVASTYIGDHATEVMQDCVQLHGGIGVTWEHDLHLFLRRAAVNRMSFGQPHEHREKIAELIGMGSPT